MVQIFPSEIKQAHSDHDNIFDIQFLHSMEDIKKVRHPKEKSSTHTDFQVETSLEIERVHLEDVEKEVILTRTDPNITVIIEQVQV